MRSKTGAATRLLNGGVGFGTVRQLLGHCYAELSCETVRHELDTFAHKKMRAR